MVLDRKSSPIPATSHATAMISAEKRTSLPHPKRKIGHIHKHASALPSPSRSTDRLKQTTLTACINPIEPKMTNRSSTTHSAPADPAQILKGVVACLDIRTEDGDDVSQNFERALQSMGAKTRRTFSDSITHLIFKNGSPATLRKALTKHVSIVSLLWVTQCKREGRRLPEKDFLIDRPQTLVLTGNKRRKSMEPSKVRALAMDGNAPAEQRKSLGKRPASTFISLDPRDKRSKPQGNIPEERPGQQKGRLSLSLLHMRERRKALDALQWETAGISEHDDSEYSDTVAPPESASQSMWVTEQADTLSSEGDNTRQQGRHSRKAQQETCPQSPSISKPQVKKEIKDEFYLGTSNTTVVKPSRHSIAGSTSLPPLRRKKRSIDPRQSLGGLLSPLPPATLTMSSSESAPRRDPPTTSRSRSTTQNRHIISQITPPDTNPIPCRTVVMTSIDEASRKKYTHIIERLGTFEVAKGVDDRTAYIIVGRPRRTETLLMGMLYGLWIVKPQWLADSGKAGYYMPEEAYEAIDFFPRIRTARLRERSLLPRNTQIFVNSSCYRAGFVEDLVTKAGGSIASNERDADVIVSAHKLDKDKVVVNDNWLLDTIEQWRYLPTDAYSMTMSHFAS